MQSMTGFGKAVSEFTDKKVVIEVKSLNSKQLDLYTKINYFYRSKELEIRNLVQQELGRGKVELSLMVDQGDIRFCWEVNGNTICVQRERRA